MEDRDACAHGRLVHIGDADVDVEIEGAVHTYRCYRAAEITTALAEGTPRGENKPAVIVIERWGIMLLPIGPKGSPPPGVISFFENAVRLQGGGAVEALSSEETYHLMLYKIARPS